MKILLNRGTTYSVEIQGGYPYINLELPPTTVYELILALDAKREEIRDMANNYFECRDCGETHHKSVMVCPNTSDEEEH